MPRAPHGLPGATACPPSLGLVSSRQPSGKPQPRWEWSGPSAHGGAVLQGEAPVGSCGPSPSAPPPMTPPPHAHAHTPAPASFVLVLAGEAAGRACGAAAHPERAGEGAAGAPGGERPGHGAGAPTPRSRPAGPPRVGRRTPWARAWADAQWTRQKGPALASSGPKRLSTLSLTQHGYWEAKGPWPDALPSSRPPRGPPGLRRAGPQLSFIIRSSLTKLLAAAGTPRPHPQATSACPEPRPACP